MDRIVNLLNTDILSSDECYSYLSRDTGSDLPLLFADQSKLVLAQNLFLKQKLLQTDYNKIDLLRIACAASSNISDGVNVEAKLTASRLLLGVCTTSVSSAFGILRSNVLNQIVGVILKVSLDRIHNRSTSSKRTEDEEDGEGEKKEDAGEVDMTALASSLFVLLKEVYQAAHLFWQRSEEYLLDSFSEALVSVVCLGATKQDTFGDCAIMAGSTLALFACQNESCLMMTYRNLLPVVTLSGRDLKLPDASKYKVQCHVSACKILVAVIKCSRKLVSGWGASSKTPKKTPLSASASKPRRSPSTSVISAPATPGSPSLKSRPGSIVRTPASTSNTGIRTPVSASGSENECRIAVPYACAIGLIQRLLLTTSERAIPRVTIIASATSLINALQVQSDSISAVDQLLNSGASDKKKASKSSKEGLSSRRGGRAVAEDTGSDLLFPSPHAAPEARGRDLHPGVESVKEQQHASSRVLSFLVKLSKSAKLHHRSLSLDIGASLLQEDWLIAKYNPASDANGADLILQMLVERCCDVAATVRSRALGALWDLLESLSNIKRFENVDFFSGVYSLLVGEGQEQGADETQNVLFLDRVRELACDSKPLVRVKAIQTLVLALTIEWPKVSVASVPIGFEPSVDNMEYVQLYLSNDDVSVISERCSDQSIAVRKQAVTCLGSLLRGRPLDTLLQEAWIDAVLPLILDPESSVQTKVAQSVFDVILLAAVKEPSSGANEAVWSICSKIGESGCTKLLQTAVTAAKRNGLLKLVSDKSTSVVLHDVLKAVKQACCVMLVEAEGNDVNTEGNTFLSQEGERQDINALRQQDFEVVSSGAWILLEALTVQAVQDVEQVDGADAVSADFVVRCWVSRRQQNANMEDVPPFFLDELEIRMLRVMAKVASSVKVASKRTVCSMLRHVLSNAQCDAQGVSAALTVLLSFSNDAESADESHYSDSWLQHIQEFSGQLLNVAHDILFRFIWGLEKSTKTLYLGSSANPGRINLTEYSSDELSPLVSCALFFIGDISMLGFSVEEDEDSFVTKECGLRDLPTCLVSDTSGTFKVHIPDVLVTMVQILMGHELPDSATGDSATLDKTSVSALSMSSDDSVVFSNSAETGKSSQICNKIRAQAFVIMGKLCLRSRLRARDHVNVFLRELKPGKEANTTNFDSLNQSASALSTSHLSSGGSEGSHAVRSNSLIVLGDLCVRFTNLVDRHVGSMSTCLQDPNVMVRRHAFVLLTQLLLQEYIKWRGMLLFRFLAVVVDRDEEIAELSKYVLTRTLQSKYSGFMVQNFSEAIIVFNNCSGHATYRAMAAIGADGGSCAVSMDGVDLSGPFKKSLRMQIYQFMMEDITEEDKIQITANLSQDILSYALDFPIETSTAGGGMLSPFESALEDAFSVLRSPLLRVGSKRGGNSTQADEEEDGGDAEAAIANEARSALHKAKTKVLKKLSVQHLVEHMLPVVSSLKHYLECKRSPVQKSLMEYLMYLVHTHKAEVALALASDPGLKDEIEYDIKLYEREKNEESKRHKIHAAEKAVLNLEMSTARKSSAKPSSLMLSRMSPADDEFTDRLVSGGGSSGSRRLSRGTPQMGSSKTGATSKVKFSGRDKRGSVTNDDDLSDRLGLEDRSSPGPPAIPSNVSARKWSVNIAALDDSTSSTDKSSSVSSKKRRGQTKSHHSVLGEVGLVGMAGDVLASDDADCGAPVHKKNKVPTSVHAKSSAPGGRRGKGKASNSLLSLN